jgi:hypothetical protein
MAIHFEDCVGCLTNKVIYPPFDFAFLFDHFQGYHEKKLAFGLDAYSMNKGFGEHSQEYVSPL